MINKGRISKLFCAHWGERTASGAARKALEALIPNSSKSTIPIDVLTAAKYVGIEQVLEEVMENCDGLLSATPSGSYVASIRKGQSLARRRFTLAHEVGHAIVYRSIGRHASMANGGRLQCRAETADEKDEERLCDVIAAEMIMPRGQFLQTMDETGVSASTVPQIAHRFGVSLQAASRRVAQAAPYDIGVGLWTMNEANLLVVPKWYLTKKGAKRLERAIEVSHPSSACFGDKPVRGWRWIPLHGEMEKYFVDVCPLRSNLKAWLVLVVFGDAPQHIMTTMSKGRGPVAVDGQMPLIGE